MTAPTPLIAGNWKMNGLAADLTQIDQLAASPPLQAAELLVCPPVTLLERVARRLDGTGILTGAQTCHPAASGAHTGEVSAMMLADAGASYVIVGHSERRAANGEGDADARARLQACWSAGLTAILCIGESAVERSQGAADSVVGRQLRDGIPDGATAQNLALAYEPVWAIGSGQAADRAIIAHMHRVIRSALSIRLGAEIGSAIRLLYGGSVNPRNASEILATADVNGALIGGASLSATDFLSIAHATAT